MQKQIRKSMFLPLSKEVTWLVKDVIEISPFNLWVFSDLIKWAVFKGFSNHTVRGQIGQEGGYVV